MQMQSSSKRGMTYTGAQKRFEHPTRKGQTDTPFRNTFEMKSGGRMRGGRKRR